MESLAQSENEQRIENIKWGLKQRAAQGTSKLYNRKCYGYNHYENGELIINFQQANASRSNLYDENNRKSKKYSSKDVNKNKK